VQNFAVPCFVLLVYNDLNNIIFKVENSKVIECDIQNSAQEKAYSLSINLSLGKQKRVFIVAPCILKIH
jgi:hypothetical protein